MPYFAVLLLRGEFRAAPGLLAIYMVHRWLQDCSLVLLGAALLRRFVAGWAGLIVWPALCALLACADAAVYHYSAGVLELFHLQLVSPAYLLRFWSPFVAILTLTWLALCGLFAGLYTKRRESLPFVHIALAGAVCGLLAVINLPYWCVEAKTLQRNGPEALRQQSASERLRALTRSPVTGLSREALTPNPFTVRRATLLPQVQPTLAKFGLPLGVADEPPLPLKPFRVVILITTESLSLQLLGGYNPALPAALTPFYSSTAVRSHMHTDYFTSGTPTRQGLLTTFASHPNAALLLAGGTGNSFVHTLRQAGFTTTFIKGDARDYSPEYHVLHQLGFDAVFAKEEFAADAAVMPYIHGVGVADYFIYDKLTEHLQTHPGKQFIALLGVDTHPGQRQFYADLAYPSASSMLADRHAGRDTLQAVVWHDHDMQRLWQRLHDAGLWQDDVLLILTADHCRPLAADLEDVPDYPQDSLCRIPLVFLTPQPLPPMARAVASQVDLAPSLMHLLGLPRQPGWWGRSVFALDKRNPAVGIFARSLTLRPTAQSRRDIARDTPATQDDAALINLTNTLFINPPAGGEP